MTIEDKLDLATLTLNAVQPKIQQLHRDLCQEATICVFLVFGVLLRNEAFERNMSTDNTQKNSRSK